MSTKELLDAAMKLNPEDRFALVESLLETLDHPDKAIDAIWAEEAEKRLRAYETGTITAIPADEILA
jgi:putative addiction module component (TIGR02574 family)